MTTLQAAVVRLEIAVGRLEATAASHTVILKDIDARLTTVEAQDSTIE